MKRSERQREGHVNLGASHDCSVRDAVISKVEGRGEKGEGEGRQEK